MNGRSSAGAIWLLARLRLLRLLNMTAAVQFSGGKRNAEGKSRAASRGKKSSRWLLGLIVGAAMLFAFTTMMRTSVLNLHCKFDSTQRCVKLAATHSAERMHEMASAHLHANHFSPALAAAATLMLLLMWLVSFLLPLASKEMAQADWDLEWLVTLPVERGTLLWARVLERSIANPTGILALWPLCMVLAWYGNHGGWAPLLGAAAAFALLMLAALMRTLADTGLRLSLPASQLRNLQALASVLSMPLMYVGISYSTWSNNSFTLDWARSFPAWTLWTPPGLAVQALTAATTTAALQAAALLCAQVGALLLAGMAVLRHQLRGGVLASGAREAARRGKSAAAATASPQRWRIGTVLQRRELMLLGRDRNFLVQSLLIPVVLIVSQLLVSGRFSSITLLGQNQQMMAAIAFGIGSYVLLLSAFQSLNTEGNALWMLYTFPRPISALLKEKAQLWGVLAMLYPLLVFAIGLAYTPSFNWPLLGYIAIVLAGIPIYALIAVSLGVFASDPQAQETQARVRPTYAYLYMLLCGLYTYALYAGDWLQALAIIILTAALALALWQKAQDTLPFLLDPGAAPPARVALSDGLIAAMLFFVLQHLVAMLMGGAPGRLSTATFAFAIAGGTVYALVRYLYWRHKTAGIPVIFSRQSGAWAGTVHALPAALAACAFGALYMWLLRDTPWWPRQRPHGLHLVLLLTVLAAPLFEEFIFRGLIFGGLRRLGGALPAAAASAALFAIVHPAVSMAPVFVLGVCTAWAYERSKSLLAPMLVHATYNAMVVGVQVAL